MLKLSEPRVRDLELGDDLTLAEQMRSADRAEVEAAFGPDLLAALRLSIASSTHVWVGEARGQLACIMGVGPASMVTTTGRPWLLATPLLDAHAVSLGRLTALYLGRMLDAYPHLENWVDSRHSNAVRWLRRIGFTLHAPQPMGPLGVPFHRFEMERR